MEKTLREKVLEDIEGMVIIIEPKPHVHSHRGTPSFDSSLIDCTRSEYYVLIHAGSNPAVYILMS